MALEGGELEEQYVELISRLAGNASDTPLRDRQRAAHALSIALANKDPEQQAQRQEGRVQGVAATGAPGWTAASTRAHDGRPALGRGT